MVEQPSKSTEWSLRIRRLMEYLGLTQAGLATRLGVSPATVSRRLADRHEPTAETYVALGNLAGKGEEAYFWERAGLNTSELAAAGLNRAVSSLKVALEDFNLI